MKKRLTTLIMAGLLLYPVPAAFAAGPNNPGGPKNPAGPMGRTIGTACQGQNFSMAQFREWFQHRNRHQLQWRQWDQNAQWGLFDVVLEGADGEGTITIIDNNPVFDYQLAEGTPNGSLENGDTVLIQVLNSGGNIVKTISYTVSGLGDEPVQQPVELQQVYQSLSDTYGAVRFLNFSNLGSGAEVYLTDEQNLLGTTERTQIDFYHGTTTDGETPIGSWEERNRVRFGYDSDAGKVWVEVNAQYEYRAEYDTDKGLDLNAIQLMLVNREPGSVVKFENIRVNGYALEDSVLVGDASWPKWNIDGDIQNSHGNFTIEGDLVITGTQPNNELNKMEIVFGKV